MRIHEVVRSKKTSGLIAIGPNTSIAEAVKSLCDNNIGAVVITGPDGTLQGILSERDVIRAFHSHGSDAIGTTVDKYMTSSVITCTMHDQFDEIYNQMVTKGIRHVPVVEGDKPTTMLSIRDFESAYRRLQDQSVTDDATGLHNHRFFSKAVDIEFNRFRRYGSPLSAALMFIDGYDELLKKSDPGTGDELVKRVADLIDEDCRPFDELSHLGNGEFGIVFPNTEFRTAKRVCERLQKHVREGSGGRGKLTLSVGVTRADDNTGSATDLMDRARALAEMASAEGGDLLRCEEPAEQKSEPNQAA